MKDIDTLIEDNEEDDDAGLLDVHVHEKFGLSAKPKKGKPKKDIELNPSRTRAKRVVINSVILYTKPCFGIYGLLEPKMLS